MNNNNIIMNFSKHISTKSLNDYTIIYNQEVICILGAHQIGQWTCQSDVSSGQI